MENSGVDPCREKSSDGEEGYHSASESPSFVGDGAPGPSALLAFQIAVACTVFKHIGRSKPRLPDVLGLPQLAVKRKGLRKKEIPCPQRAGAFAEGQLQEETGGNVRASPARRQEQLWSDPGRENLSSVESLVLKCLIQNSFPQNPPILRRRSKAALPVDHSSHRIILRDEEGSLCLPKRMSMDVDLDTVGYEKSPLRQPKRRSMKMDLDTVQDERSSFCMSKRRPMDIDVVGDDEGFTGLRITRSMDRDLDTAGELSEECPQEREISSESSVNRSFPMNRGPSPLHQRGKRHYRSSGYETNAADEGQVGEEREVDENLDNFCTDTVSEDESELQDSRLHVQKKDLEGSLAYRMPEDTQSNSLLLWPVGLAVEAIEFQVRLIAQAFSLIGLLFNWCNSFASNRVHETLQAKDRATEALSQKVSLITHVPPKVTERGSIILKRAAWGCLAATYVCILLSMLLFPALLLDYIFLSKIVEEPVSVREPLHFDYTLPHPTAVISLHPSRGVHSSTGKLVRHSERVRAIPVSHKVHITVMLTLPESDYNRNLGMFQLTAELLSESGQSIKSSSRPCMLRFHSAPIRWLKTFLVSLPSLVGMFSESQTLVIRLMGFEEQHVPTSAVRILLQPKAGMPLGQGIPEIYFADVYIESHLPWLKDLVRNWKWTFYIWTGLMLYIVEVIMVLCFCRQALVPKTWVGQTDEVNSEQVEQGNSTSMEVNEGGSLGRQLPKKQATRKHQLSSFDEQIPIARAMTGLGERKSE